MTSPYINTVLFTNVTLFPSQMNNDVYQSLKQNLVEDIKGKCYGDYGYVVDIYEILNYGVNRIDAENTMGSCVYNVKFSCRLCRPINKTTIVCKINRLNKLLVRCVNGPINLIVTTERINSDTFFRDNNRDLRFKSENGSQLLGPEHYVKVRIINNDFLNRSTRIIGIGFLESIATKDDIEGFFREQYDNSGRIISFDEYIRSLERNEEETVVNEEAEEAEEGEEVNETIKDPLVAEDVQQKDEDEEK